MSLGLGVVGAYEVNIKIRKVVLIPLDDYPYLLHEQAKFLQVLYPLYFLHFILLSIYQTEIKKSENQLKWENLCEGNQDLKVISQKLRTKDPIEIKEHLAALIAPRNLPDNQQESSIMKICKKIGTMALIYFIINKIS